MPAHSLLTIAHDWSLFQQALGGSGQINETTFSRMGVSERLKQLVARTGTEQIIEEINESLRRLGVSHLYGCGGFACDNQGDARGVALGWEVDPDQDPAFLSIDPCRFLPSLIRLEDRIGPSPGAAEFESRRKAVRRIAGRCR